MGRKEIEEDIHGPKKIKSKEPRELRLRDILYFGKYMAWSIGNVIKVSWEYVEWMRETLGFWYSDEVKREIEEKKKSKEKGR